MADPVVLAVDIEGTGQCFVKNPIVEVGICVKRLSNGETLFRSSHVGRAALDEYEPRCVREFWNKVDLDGKRRLAYAAAQSQHDMWAAVLSDFQDAFVKYKKVQVVSDNPAYDIAGISFNFQRYLCAPDVHYVSGEYVPVRDAHSALDILALFKEMPRKEFESQLLKWFHEEFPESEPTPHDHNAANDAAYIANTWIAARHFAGNCLLDACPF